MAPALADEGTGSKLRYVNITEQVELANIRSGPSMDHRAMWAVVKDYPLLVLEQGEEWSQVEDFRKRKGWVANRLLADNETVIVKGQKVKLFRQPDTNDYMIGEVDYGTVLHAKEEQKEWIKVTDRQTGLTGWLRKTAVWPQ